MVGALDGVRVLLGGEPPRGDGSGHRARDHIPDHAAAPRHGAQPDDRQGEPEAAELALLLPSAKIRAEDKPREVGQGRDGKNQSSRVKNATQASVNENGAIRKRQ